jgi:hypothetical protein
MQLEKIFKSDSTQEKLTNHSDLIPRSLEFPESNVDGNATLTLSLQFVEHPSILEGFLAQLFSFL